MSVSSVVTTLFHIVVAVLVRTSIAAEPLAVEASQAATAEHKPLIRTVARESQKLTEGVNGFPDGELTGAKPAQDAKSPVRRIAHDGDEQETWTLISDSFCIEIGIACIGFSITALMQRFVGAKSRTLRKKINQPTSESPRSQSKSGPGFPRRHSDNALSSRASSKQQSMPATTSRNASAAAARDGKNDSAQPFMTECDGYDAANDQSDKLERPDMRKLLALVTGKPPLKDIPGLVLRCIAGIEARTGKTLTSKQTLDASIQLLRACASGKCFKEGIVAFDALESRLGSGSHSLWSLLLYIATEAGAYERCEDFYLRLQDAPGPAGRDFVNVVRAYAKRDDLAGLQAALHAIGRSEDKGITEDRMVRNRALAACCKEGAVNLAVAIANSDAFTKSLDTVGYNTLITCFARAGEYQRGFDTFDEMQARGIQPTEATFGSLLEACCGTNDVKRAKDYLAKLKGHGLAINAVHCTTLIKAMVGEKFLADAESVLVEFTRDSNVSLDIISFYTLIKAYTDGADLKAAIRVYDTLIQHGVKPDEFVFNALINGCALDTRVTVDDFNLLIQRLLAAGLQPSTTTLSVMLKSLARCGAWDEALTLMESAPERFNARVETRLYVQIAQAAIKAGSKDKAVMIHDAMVLTQGRRGQEGKAASRWLLRQCDSSRPGVSKTLKRGNADQRFSSSPSRIRS